MTEKIINTHAHIYPDKIASKAVYSIGEFYGIKMELDGTCDGLIKDGHTIGCENFVVCSVATTPHQVESINSFIIEECSKHKEFTGLGSIHPDCDNIDNIIDNIVSNGLKGIKLHPDFQKFNIDDKKAFPIYKACEGKIPILFHIGDERQTFSEPEKLASILNKFPKLKVIAAHLGGYRSWDKIDCLMKNRNVYIDCSSSLAFMSPEKANKIIHTHGTDRVIFGTDYPMWTHKDEIDRFNKLDLNTEERDLILWKNASELFEIR